MLLKTFSTRRLAKSLFMSTKVRRATWELMGAPQRAIHCARQGVWSAFMSGRSWYTSCCGLASEMRYYDWQILVGFSGGWLKDKL